MPDRSQLFSDIDSMEPERFTAHLADDVTMRFGNADPIHGRDAVRDTWASFCEGLEGVSHSVGGQWSSGSGTVVEAEVTYTRKDGSTVTVPVVTIYRENGELIDDYRIFIDLAPLFA
jgi:ketosteroid isomerase-like protein